MTYMDAAYKNDMQQQLRIAAKGTGWKQSKGILFRQTDEWFIAGHWRTVSADAADGLRIEIMAKPMAIDPMLWEIMGLEQNNNQPLSFRYWGAFICGTPVLKHKIIHTIEPRQAIPQMLETLHALLPEVLRLLETEKFSELARNPDGAHDNWRMGETITHALRLETQPELALKYAVNETGAFSTSRLVKDPGISGKSHNELVAATIRSEIKQSRFSRMINRLFNI